MHPFRPDGFSLTRSEFLPPFIQLYETRSILEAVAGVEGRNSGAPGAFNGTMAAFTERDGPPSEPLTTSPRHRRPLRVGRSSSSPIRPLRRLFAKILSARGSERKRAGSLPFRGPEHRALGAPDVRTAEDAPTPGARQGAPWVRSPPRSASPCSPRSWMAAPSAVELSSAGCRAQGGADDRALHITFGIGAQHLHNALARDLSCSLVELDEIEVLRREENEARRDARRARRGPSVKAYTLRRAHDR